MTKPQPQPEFNIIDDPRYDALEFADDWADLLCGDVVLMPFKDGEPDWDHCTRQSLTWVGGHWEEFELEDVPRLAILTDGFSRFIEAAADISVVTLIRDGTPTVRQIDGEPCARAVDMVADAIIDDEPLRELRADLQPANDNVPPPTSNHTGRLLRLQREHGGEIRDATLFGASFDGKTGQVVIDAADRAVFHTAKSACLITETPRLYATPFRLRASTAIPQREWLHAKHYMRRYLTVTVGAGGSGKSAHAVSEVLAMVTGRPLLDPDGPLTKPLRVWYVNAEDPADEIERRFTAAAMHFGATAEQISDRLFTDTGRDQEFVIVRQDGREFKVAEPMIEDMLAVIKENQIDVVIVDPFVSTHEVPENDNGLIQRVAKQWRRVADLGNCSVELIHHITKGNLEVTADSARGGGALKDAARSVRTINPMTRDEADKAGVDDSYGYFRVDFGKANMVSRSSGSHWRRFVSVPLRNGKGIVKTGDEIGVVEGWRWPSADDLAGRRAEARRSLVGDIPEYVLDGIKNRLTGADHKANEQSKNWAGIVIAEILGIDLAVAGEKSRVKEIISSWIADGHFEIVDMQDHRRHISPHLKPVARPEK
jgi:hypothetical protein